MPAASSHVGVGALLRDWRRRRRRTQLDLALDAGISARHLSFVETGRSRPSAEMVLLLAEQLEVPFRERNQLLLAAGYAPAFPERSLQDPQLGPVRDALDLILREHEPYPAVALDRYWDVIAVNSVMGTISQWVDPQLLTAPANAMRVGLHPSGLARWILNLGEVRAHFLGRLERQVAVTGDARLAALLEEVSAYPAPEHAPSATDEMEADAVLTPLMRLRGPEGPELSFFATVMTFGTAGEVTTSELSVELAFPADATTAQALRALPRA
jgi:transcriptional regulator with XRE-family HTH domain